MHFRKPATWKSSKFQIWSGQPSSVCVQFHIKIDQTLNKEKGSQKDAPELSTATCQHWGDWPTGWGSVAGGKMIACSQRACVWEYATGITNEQLCHAFPIFLMGLGSLQSYEKHYPPINSKGESPIQENRRNLNTHLCEHTNTHLLMPQKFSLHQTSDRCQSIQHSMYMWQSCICLSSFLSFSVLFDIFLERRVQRWREMMLFKK